MSKKIVIIILVFAGVLFFLALGSNWLPSSNSDEASFNPEDSGLLSGLQNVFSSFDKKLSASRLTPRATCWVSNGRYRLVNDKQCIIEIASTADRDGHQSLVLETKEGVIIKVPCRETTQTRGLQAKFMVLKPQFGRAKITRIDPVSGMDPTTKPPIKMEMKFKTEKSTDKPLDCIQKSPAKLVVFGEGGTLELRCPTCNKSRSIEVQIK